MDGILTVIATLSGTAIGGFITYRIASQQQSHERRVDREQRVISACESIHELLSKLSSQALSFNVAVLGDLSFDLPLKAERFNEKVELDRLRMLVDFYTPLLQPEVKDISKQFEVLSRSIGELIMKRRDRDDKWVADVAERCTKASLEASRIARETQEKLAEIVRSFSLS